MGLRTRDKTWPKPRLTRHVWLTRPGRHTPPVQAYVLDRRRYSYRWYACVVWSPDDGQAIQEWVPYERLGPVPVTERQMPGNPHYFAGF